MKKKTIRDAINDGTNEFYEETFLKKDDSYNKIYAHETGVLKLTKDKIKRLSEKDEVLCLFNGEYKTVIYIP